MRQRYVLGYGGPKSHDRDGWCVAELHQMLAGCVRVDTLTHMSKTWSQAIGTWPAALGQVANSTVGRAEVLAFYAQLDEVSEVWVCTATWVARIESSSQAALVVTVPITRVSRIAELYHERGYELRIELDAEGYTQLAADGVSRLVRTSYTVTPSGEGIGQAQHLAAVLRTLI